MNNLETLSKEFERFVKNQTDENGDDQYVYDEEKTRKNRVADLLKGSLGRLESTYKRFMKEKHGTYWELAQSYDYHLLKNNKKNHHIVAVSTEPACCHTFNIYVDDGALFITDLFQHVKATKIKDCDSFKKILKKMFKPNFRDWWVMSEVENSMVERFKKLGSKCCAKFCSETESGGGFVVIDPRNEKFELNEKSKVKWTFAPFKFAAWG